MITLAPGNVIFNQGAGQELTIRNQSFYLVRTDLRGNFTYLNSLFCSVRRIQAIDVVGKNALRLVFQDDQDACILAIKKLKAAAPDHLEKVILREETGSGLLSTEWEFILLRDQDQQPKEILCIGHDITKLVKKQESLQQLLNLTKTQNKRLQEFTYIVSHNIRSHVANLSGIVHTVI